MFVQLVASGLVVGGVYALIALGFSIVISSTQVLNFAQGEFAMLGALFGVTFFTQLELPYPIAFLLTVACVGVVGILVSRSTLEPLVRRKAHLHSMVIATLGAAFLIQSGSELIWGKDDLFAKPPLGDTNITIMRANFVPQSFIIFAVVLVSLALTWYFFQHTLMGKSFKAVALNRDAARLMGIDVERAVLLSFGLSAALGAAAGLAFSPIVSANAYMGMTLSIKGFAAMLIGGAGSSLGAVIGGLILGFLEAFGAGYISAGYRDAISFLVMLLVLCVSPSGIVGLTSARSRKG
ncbi:MAG: branched-chain amino acid ABC transporter permease [Chloroflexi bacterium]|nr:branched-chain amino acid ABC transporter permease [Chloroflexota bacterium]